MRNTTRTVLGALAAALLAPGTGLAASVGNPIEVEEARRLTVGFEAEYVRTGVSDETVTSNRYLVKGTVRPAPWADVVLRAGAGDVNVDAEIAGSPVHFDANPRFAWGGGVRVTAWRSETARFSPRLVLSADGLLLLSTGEADVALAFPTATLEERFVADYHWREFQGSAVLAFEASPLFPYAGVSVRGIDGEVKRRQYDLTGSNPNLVADATEEFGSSLSPYLLGGLDYRVGPTFRISAEGFFRDRDDYGFFVGFSERSR